MWIFYLGRYDEPNYKEIDSLDYMWLDELMARSF
jgi:hypothetical protein